MKRKCKKPQMANRHFQYSFFVPPNPGIWLMSLELGVESCHTLQINGICPFRVFYLKQGGMPMKWKRKTVSKEKVKCHPNGFQEFEFSHKEQESCSQNEKSNPSNASLDPHHSRFVDSLELINAICNLATFIFTIAKFICDRLQDICFMEHSWTIQKHNFMG